VIVKKAEKIMGRRARRLLQRRLMILVMTTTMKVAAKKAEYRSLRLPRRCPRSSI